MNITKIQRNKFRIIIEKFVFSLFIKYVCTNDELLLNHIPFPVITDIAENKKYQERLTIIC